MINIDPPLAVVLIIFSLIGWASLCEYSPADGADHAERMQQAALYRRERQLVVVVWLLGVIVVLGFVCLNQRDLREIYWGFFFADRLLLREYSPADIYIPICFWKIYLVIDNQIRFQLPTKSRQLQLMEGTRLRIINSAKHRWYHITLKSILTYYRKDTE